VRCKRGGGRFTEAAQEKANAALAAFFYPQSLQPVFIEKSLDGKLRR
jgi:hypothetical protein